MGIDEFHTEGGRSKRRGDATEERRQAICHGLQAVTSSTSATGSKKKLPPPLSLFEYTSFSLNELVERL